MDFFLAVTFGLMELHFRSWSKVFRGHCAHGGGVEGGKFSQNQDLMIKMANRIAITERSQSPRINMERNSLIQSDYELKTYLSKKKKNQALLISKGIVPTNQTYEMFRVYYINY